MSSVAQEEICRFRGTTENFLIVVAFITIFLLSVGGNALVMIVIVKQRAMRSITNIYLMNLALTDLMLSVVCMPPTLVSMVMNCWMFGSVGCKLFAYLQPMVVTASAYTLAVIAFERYFAICRPLHSRIWQTRSHAYVMITLVWTIAILANILMLFMYEQRIYNSNGITCTPIHEPIYHFAYQVYMTVVLLLVPLVMMTVLYGSVIGSLKTGIRLEIAAVADSTAMDNESQYCLQLPTSQSQQHLTASASCAVLTQLPASTDDGIVDERKKTFLQKLTQKFSFKRDSKPKPSMAHRRSETSMCMESNSLRSTHNQKSAIAKQRVIKMLIVVVIIFFCCWTPSYIWWLLLSAGDSFQNLNLSVWNSDINTFITLLTYISSCTNPITYCFLNKKFRNAVYATFGRKKVMRQHFQKVYIPVNGTTPNGTGDKPMFTRSISTSFNPQHQVVFDRPRKSVHASLIQHHRPRRDEAIF